MIKIIAQLSRMCIYVTLCNLFCLKIIYSDRPTSSVNLTFVG